MQRRAEFTLLCFGIQHRGLGQRLVTQHRDAGIDLRVCGVDARETGEGQLAAGDGATL
jgi:hypothetical protein